MKELKLVAWIYLICLFIVAVVLSNCAHPIKVVDDVITIGDCTLNVTGCVATECGPLVTDCAAKKCDPLALSLCLIGSCADDVRGCVEAIEKIVEDKGG